MPWRFPRASLFSSKETTFLRPTWRPSSHEVRTDPRKPLREPGAAVRQGAGAGAGCDFLPDEGAQPDGRRPARGVHRARRRSADRRRGGGVAEPRRRMHRTPAAHADVLRLRETEGRTLLAERARPAFDG